MGILRFLGSNAAVSLVNGDLHETAVKIGGIKLHTEDAEGSIRHFLVYTETGCHGSCGNSRTPICADPAICAPNLRIQHPHIRRPACKVFMLRASNTPNTVTGHFSFSRSLLRDIQVAIRDGNIPCVSHRPPSSDDGVRFIGGWRRCAVSSIYPWRDCRRFLWTMI